MQILTPPYQEKLDSLLERVGVIQRLEPGSSLHISPVPGTTTPMAFAWVGPDVPQTPPYVIPTRYASLMGESWPAAWSGHTFRDACEAAQRFFVRGAPRIVPCPPALMAYWNLPPSPSLQDAAAPRASSLTPQTAVLWYAGPSGPLLATDDAGAPVVAQDVATLAQTYGCAVTPLDLPARTRLDTLVNAAAPTHPRWHVSPVQASRVPLAFAWFGPDVLSGASPMVLTRGPDTALWTGGSPQQAIDRALAALADRQIPAVAVRCPPEARSVGLSGASAKIATPVP